MKSPAAWGLFLLGVSAVGWVGVQAWHRQASLALQRAKIEAETRLEQAKLVERQKQALEDQQREENLMTGRRVCDTVAVENAKHAYQAKMREVNEFSLREYGSAVAQISPTTYLKEDYEVYYKQCLRSGGIE